jgi:hypothetical protein
MNAMVAGGVGLAAEIAPADGPRGSALADWEPLWAFLGVFLVLLASLFVAGRRTQQPPLLRIPAALERITGVPAWAVSTLLFSVYGLAVAGYGFYTDVAWHVALGRDDDLFTAPHTAILTGLVMIAVSPLVGTAVATAQRRPTELRLAGFHVPWSLVPLAVLGVAAVSGFPVDELWHQQYGVDVTMWSPPHLVMILAASFSGLASWLVLADAGVGPTNGRWGRGLHVVTAALTLQGLSSVQGEFSYGVPQWQHLYHPVLTCLAAGVALVLIRIVHGRGWALGIATGVFLFQMTDILGGGEPIDTRAGATYVGSALVVEVVAWVLGTERRLRFAAASGVGIGTIGLATEWWWNQGAHQPWTTSLLPEAVLLGVLAASCGAVIGAASAGAIAEDRRPAGIPAGLVALALIGVLAALAIPAPRPTGDVTATIALEWVDDDRAVVDATLEPADAADDARWFTVGSWQWGGRTVLHMREVAPGRYTSEEPVLLTGRAKSLLRLHRGAEMMAVPIRLPADPEYDLDEVAPRDRTAAFEPERRYLQREADAATGTFALGVYALVAILVVAWVATFSLAVSRISRRAVGAPDGGADGARQTGGGRPAARSAGSARKRTSSAP